MRTCVLGHGWNEGQVLCPTCGFGPRTGQPELVSAAAPAAHAEVAPAAPVSPAPVVDDRPRSEDGSWVWDGSAWEPAEELVPLVPAQATSPETDTDPAPARTRRGRPSPRALLVGVLLLVVAAVVGAYALGLFGGGTKAAPPAPVAKGHPKAAAAAGATATDARVKAQLLAFGAAVTRAQRSGTDLVENGYPYAANPDVTATKGTKGACGYASLTPGRWFVWSTAHGLRPAAYPTSDAAIAACY